MTQNAPAPQKETTPCQVIFFLEGALLSLGGKWQWGFKADHVLCSDVMFFPEIAFPNVQDVQPVVKTLIHPDDLERVKHFVSHIEENHQHAISYRVITTGGQVKTVECYGITDIARLEGYDNLYNHQAEQAAAEKQNEEKLARQELRVQVCELAERFTDMGTWAYHTATNEAFYSDQVYRMHGLPPQSLNAHVNTFSGFIHPDDSAIFADAFDRAFKEQVPLHLEYRIVRNDQQVRFLQYITSWTYAAQGAGILYGFIKDVTEERQLEKMFEDAEQGAFLKEQSLQYLEEASAAGRWLVNLYTRKTTYSDNVYRIYGLKPQSVPASISFFKDLTHPEDKERVQEAQQKIFREHVGGDLEFRIIRKSGEIRHLRQKGKVFINADKEVMMMGILKDITEEKQLELLLQEQKWALQLQNFAHSSAEKIAGMGSWLMNMENGEVKWSDSLYLLLGLKSGGVELTQKRLMSFIHPDDRYYFKTQVDHIYENEADNEFQVRLIQKGVVKFMKASFKLLRQENSKYLLGLLQDTTDQYLLNQHLVERVQFIEQLSDTIQDQLCVTDTANIIISWNTQCEKRFGLSKEKAIGQHIFDVLPQLKAPEIVSVFEKALQGQTIEVPQEQDQLRKGLYDHYAVPLKNELGDITAAMHIWHNVTQQVHLQEQLSSRLHFIENLVESSIDCIIVLDKNMNYLYWNSRCVAYYGLQQQEVVGKNILDVFPGFKTAPTYEDFKKALKGETVQIPIQEAANKPGTFLETTLVPLKNDNGEVFAVLWMMHDVTHERQLYQHQKRAEGILQSLHEAFFEIDLQWRVQYVNDLALQLWRRQKKDVIGNELLEVFPQIMHTPFYNAIVEAVENKCNVRQEFQLPNGRWMLASIAPSDAGVMVVCYDIRK